ncbi:MAG: undecaprenyl-diphosphate phosphatase [Bryobacteraceae bacterium]|nr:undecaprenyl-diphosphate phosphatase [Bryobacteraceae bacterium]
MNLLYLKALLLGIVEGITEFLPISSTGHLILVGSLLHFNNEKAKVFEIVIQTGAMLALLWEYRARLLRVTAGLANDAAARRFVINVLVAFVPAVVIGLAFSKVIKSYLFYPVPVALAFIIGGVVILWAERREHQVRISDVDQITWRDALKIGLAQCLALVPGTSRSGATIIAGLLFGYSRQAATEFSFFLAMPTLIGAGIYSTYKERALLSSADLGWFSLGSVAAFVSAYFSIRWLLRYISTHDFSAFAWYRIGFGVLILLTAWSGLINWTPA